MRRKRVVIIVTILVGIIVCGVAFLVIGLMNQKINEQEDRKPINQVSNQQSTQQNNQSNSQSEKVEDNNEVISNMKVVINNQEYIADIQNNETAWAFIEMLPLEYQMKELNGNEKYSYLNRPLPSNPSNWGKVEKGDIMLFGEDCLVVFYQSLSTNYNYTKIGHIQDFPNLNKEPIQIEFIK